ncbi:MAG: PD-(D/E)XK nuclease family protein [Bacteroidales bacterium]|nr:PD-(D/E)XK nuclease family protein [Bacteroidales bacterium]
MDAFLLQAARHYFACRDIGETCFIFPNRRSMVFFRKYLGDLVRGKGGKPMLCPSMFTVNDFFSSLYGGKTTDRLRLLTALYREYSRLNPKAESLDDFIFWGDVLLADFDDVDKYLADPRSLFRNIEDLKDIQDSFDYLSEIQKKAIQSFLGHFRDARDLASESTSIKGGFIRLWNLLLPLYTNFKSTLKENGMAYEGMVYRALAERLKEGVPVVDILSGAFPDTRKYVFIGLNALNECERLLLRRMRDAGVAEFVWDYVTGMLSNESNKSSFFMKRNVEEFPQAFTILAGGTPQITAISVPSAVGQVKIVPQLLSMIDGDPVENAFVLPDESLLLPLLNSIPPEYDSINVTMGYPMKGSAVYTLVQALGRLQLRARHRDDGWYFYHRDIAEVFSASLFNQLLSPEEKAVVERIKADARYYVHQSQFAGGDVLEAVFTPVLPGEKKASAKECLSLCRYLSSIIARVGSALTGNGEMLLELDFAKRLHTQLNILESIPLEMHASTWLRVLDGILQGISVPFQGEPLRGLQIMGPLETRALDFRNLVILSANEGMFPRRSVSSSFIPPELRKAFALPTFEYQDAVWAYYFYRLLQRASRVWLVYDSRTEGLHSGEESRYIKQLEYHFDVKVERLVASAPLQPLSPVADITKSQEDAETVRTGALSASALQNYLYCPAKFYYSFVKKLKTPDDVAESLDTSMIGNVFHKVMQRLYSGKDFISGADIEKISRDRALIRSLVREEIMREMRSFEVSGRNLVTEEILCDYVRDTLRHDFSLVGKDGGFKILGLEQFREIIFDGYRIIGYIDRLDSYRSGEVRIVDYKTGRVEEDDIMITDENAAAVAEKLFGPVNRGRPKIALQLFIYGLLAGADSSLKGKTLVNSIYSTGRLYTGPLQDMKVSEEFSSIVKGKLSNLLREITDTSLPWSRTNETDTCKWCDFKDLCGR